MEFTKYPHKDHFLDILQHSHTQSCSYKNDHKPHIYKQTLLKALILHFSLLNHFISLIIFKSFSKSSIYSQKQPFLATWLDRLSFDLTWVWPMVTIDILKSFDCRRPCQSIKTTSIYYLIDHLKFLLKSLSRNHQFYLNPNNPSVAKHTSEII